jgi:hypothetical protein
MNSNEHSSPFRPRLPRQPWHQLPPRPHVQEDILKTNELQVERKAYVFLLKENSRGRFLRIIEEGGKFSNSIIIPSAGLNEFQNLLAEMLKAAEAIPPKPSPQ